MSVIVHVISYPDCVAEKVNDKILTMLQTKTPNFTIKLVATIGPI